MNRDDPVVASLKYAQHVMGKWLGDVREYKDIEKAIAIAEQQQRVIQATRNSTMISDEVNKELSTLDEMMK